MGVIPSRKYPLNNKSRAILYALASFHPPSSARVQVTELALPYSESALPRYL
jgi:hypothetical protein